jgi:photosystem II stability/assembly factor-like uncharacterized protein
MRLREFSFFYMNPFSIGLNFARLLGRFAHTLPAILFLLAMAEGRAQARWSATGPAGGDARAFAAVPGQPGHLYLGSTNSWIYESVDGAASWHRLARLDSSDDLIFDHIVVDSADSATIYAAAWKLDHPGGGLWVSHDQGRNWSEVEGLRGQSVRAFAQAPSAPGTLYAGTLEGVFRSQDGGATWALISPPESREIHEIESLAIDPADPNTVYAGTWHLPWKTTDGGKSWHSIKDGVIDDSDVFSIVIDPDRSQTVYVSACSGIYKSESGGERFRKIQGIPATARRTRVLMQDPLNHKVLYAGTTEGLYKTVDAGKTFKVMTGPEAIVNDVYVDPNDTNHVLLATDRGGVLASSDGAVSFAAANEGFSGRKVEALLVDRIDLARVYAGVVNDKSYGGAFVSGDGGVSWKQIGEGPNGGLDERDVFALAEAADGTVLAGTNHGIFALNSDEAAGTAEAPEFHWQPRNTIANTIVKPSTETHMGKRINVEKQVKDRVVELDGRVNALDLSGDAWLASTSFGLLTSQDNGASWQGGPVMGSVSYLSVAAHGALMVAARGDGVVLSTDAGATWMPMGIPAKLTQIHRVAFSADGTLWLGTREGVYFSHDQGKTWMWVHRLPLGDIDDLYYDASTGKVLVSSRSSDQIYIIDPKTLEWTWRQTGYRISLIRAAGERLLAASLYDGVLVEPLAPGEPQAAEREPKTDFKVKTGQK